jgi:hypothetical protein
LLKVLRPELTVERVEINDLDDRIERSPAALVIADQVSPKVRSSAAAFILYYPELRNVAVVTAGSQPRTIETPSWDDLVAEIDLLAAEIVPVR